MVAICTDYLVNVVGLVSGSYSLIGSLVVQEPRANRIASMDTRCQAPMFISAERVRECVAPVRGNILLDEGLSLVSKTK